MPHFRLVQNHGVTMQWWDHWTKLHFGISKTPNKY
jgi:hypothetical protein